MVDRSYMLDQPPGPGRAKVAFDQRVVPMAIDAAGWVEGGLERVLAAVRRTPYTGLLIAAGLGFVLAQSRRPRSR